ncbi:alpha/beta hydrolase [Maritimibacter sp. 55A14]|uniref:alpha/beta fold hydrolase n=1 Tax=Maritimibacter sp. 55A14 TaxID=2174844 RepID=UPI000D60EF01|nr:alpha/beta hydrolase [Maritimibacter sp. 55A14]PWE29404.1 alpha/beta hydrolase [Maritimibacter sp. 55A14]
MSGIAGFQQRFVETNGIRLSVHEGGEGAPLILLHGYPQNHMCWARVAPELARRYRVIVPDLRGYGQSDAPADDTDHRTYSKREMARDVAGLMDALGMERTDLIGHDRGARVAYRMALDMPERIRRLGIIEIVPTADFWDAWTAELALKAYHWTFLAQPAPLPERMIGADPVAYIDWTLASWTASRTLDAFAPAALEAYRRQASDPARVAAMCADYRAGAGIDRDLDRADRDAGRRIEAPLHYVWAEGGFPAQTGDPLGIWRRWAREVTGLPVSGCGHFAMEEAPEAVLAALAPAFPGGG